MGLFGLLVVILRDSLQDSVKYPLTDPIFEMKVQEMRDDQGHDPFDVS